MRRRSKFSPRNSHPIPISSARGFTGVMSSHCPKNCEMSRGKRAKYLDTERGQPANCQNDGSSVQHESNGPLRYDAIKTSEYAFFKKFKKDSGHSHHNPLCQDIQLKTCYKTNSIGGRSSLLLKEEGANKHDITSHRTVTYQRIQNDAEVTDEVNFDLKDIQTPLLEGGLTPIIHHKFTSIFGSASGNSGNQTCDKGGVFSTRRQRLREWLADSSFTEIEKFNSKGFDYAHLLLSRLYPEDHRNYLVKDSKSKHTEIDGEHCLPAAHELGTYASEDHCTHARILMEFENKSCWDSDSISHYSDRHRSIDTIPLQWETVGTVAPNNQEIKYACRNSVFDLDGSRNARLCDGNKSCYQLNLDECESPNESALGGNAHTLFLGWDFDSGEQIQDPSVCSQNTEMNCCTTSAISWFDDQLGGLDNKWLDAHALCPSSLSSRNSLNLTCIPNFDSANFLTHAFGGYLGELKYPVAQLDQVPKMLSCTPKYLKLVEDCLEENISAQRYPSCLNKHVSDKHYRRLETVGPPETDIDLEWECQSVANSMEHHSSNYHTIQFT